MEKIFYRQWIRGKPQRFLQIEKINWEENEKFIPWWPFTTVCFSNWLFQTTKWNVFWNIEYHSVQLETKYRTIINNVFFPTTTIKIQNKNLMIYECASIVRKINDFFFHFVFIKSPNNIFSSFIFCFIFKKNTNN